MQEKDISIVHLVLSQNAKKDSCGERLQFQADYFMSFCHRILKQDYVNFEKNKQQNTHDQLGNLGGQLHCNLWWLTA